MARKWTRENVFEESKKYSSRSEFKKGSSGAFHIAYINGWLDEMTWLVHPAPKPNKWTKDAVFEESKKYSFFSDFNRKNASAYAVARKKGWLDEMTWLKRTRVVRGFWQSRENIFNESHKYKTLKEFREACYTAYNLAKENGWLDEMTWLAKAERKPDGYWKIKENVFEESHNYQSVKEFCDANYLAYKTASDNNWLDQMTWLKKANRIKKGHWKNKETVFKEAKKYKYKSDFRRKAPSAYATAWKNGWLIEMTWFQPKGYERVIQGPIHKIYVYIDEDKKYAYVGATNNIDRRDYEHRTNSNDSVFKYFANEGKDVPKYKILREGLTIIERQREERIQSLYYRDILHYTLLNNINATGENIGSLGSLVYKWTRNKVIKEAEKYKTPTEFFTKAAGAYDAALKYKMMNEETFPWFYSKRKPPRWWNVKEHVFEESKKYKTWNEFFWKSSAAHYSARKHKWESEMTWLAHDQAVQGYWQNEEHVIEESKKYSTRTDFRKGCHAAYDYAFKHNLWKKMPWIKTKVREQGYWTKERVFEEGAKYSTKMEFKKMAPTAYSKAVKYKWIEEMNWFVSNVKPKGYWQNKQNTLNESHKYSSRSEFRWGNSGAYRASIDNGWIEEMTWLKRPKSYNYKWSRENVFIESHKYESRSAFKKGSPAAYRVALQNGWLALMVWLFMKK